MLKRLNRWFDSIRVRSVGILIVTIVLTVLTATIIGSMVARSELEAQAREEIQTLSRLVSQQIDAGISERFRAMTRVARGLTMSGEALHGRAQLLLERQHSLIAIMDGLFLVDETGRGLAALPRDNAIGNLDISDRDYFRRASNEFTTVISKPLIDRREGTPLVVIAAPIFSHSKRLIGVLVGTVDLARSSFLGRITDTRLGQGGEVVVATREGVIVASGDRRAIKATLSTDHPAVLAAGELRDGIAKVRRNDGEQVLVAFHQVNEVPWFVMVSIPVRVALAPVNRLDSVVFVVAFGVIVFFIPIALRLFSHLLAPLDDLDRQIVERHAGSRRAPVSVKGGVEIRTVAETFNAVIAEREQAEQTLEAREAFFRSLSEQSPIGIVQTDALGRIEFMNDAFLAIIGSEGQSLCGQYLSSGVDKRDRPRVVNQWRRTLGRGDVFFGRFRLSRRGAPGVTWVEAMTSNVETRDRYLGTVSVIRDITREQQLEEHLRSERNRAESIIRVLQEGVVLTDQQGVVSYANGPAVAFIGAGDEVEGQSLFDLVQFREGDRQWILDDFVTIGQVDTLDVVMVNAAGEELDIELTALRPDRGGIDDNFVFVLRDDSERRRQEERLSWEASHDSLTGLANRRRFNTVLGRIVSDRDLPCALILIDLDHFKPVNDLGGHLLGDELLRRLGTALREAFRQTDIVARMGGDEFAVILPGCGLGRATELAEKVRQSIGDIRVETDEQTFSVTASIGVTAVLPEDQTDADAINRADEAAYEAKESGRNRVHVRRDGASEI